MHNENDGHPTAKRTDVGYKRPPVEHQFKAGQKPPPRKKHALVKVSTSKSLARILAEERRIMIGKKVRWLPNGHLLIEVAFQLAEKGNSTVARALAGYLLAGDGPEPLTNETLVEHDRDGPAGVFHYTQRVKV